MKIIFTAFLLIGSFSLITNAQSIAKIKAAFEATPDPIGYVKNKLKKKYYIDTITVVNTLSFMGKADSLAYKGTIGKVYGPFKGENILVRILGKAPNTFYHVQHILLDTAVFSKKFADTTASEIIYKIKSGIETFKSMAASYSADRFSAQKGGELGWFIQGAMLPQLEAAILKHKKGDIFKVWSDAGLHIIKLPDAPKKDTGFALLLRVIL